MRVSNISSMSNTRKEQELRDENTTAANTITTPSPSQVQQQAVSKALDETRNKQAIKCH